MSPPLECMRKVKLAIVLHIHDMPLISQKQLVEYGQLFLKQVYELLDETEIKGLTVYSCGTFLEALIQKKSDLYKRLQSETASGTLEWLGGGYYDPVFPFLPASLQKMQINKLLHLLETNLSVRPRGFFPSAFIWENSMVGMLADNHFEYTILKDYQLKDCLWKYTDKDGFFCVEDRGRLVRIMQAKDAVMPLFAQGDIQGLVDYFSKACNASEPEMEDLEEKLILIDLPFFGLKRGSYDDDWIGHLQKCLLSLKEAGLPIEIDTLANIIDSSYSKGGICVPETVGRSLGLESHLHSSRELMVLQPEVNYIHKKMMHLHKRISRLEQQSLIDELENMLLPVQGVYYYRNTRVVGGITFVEDRARCYDILLRVEEKLRGLHPSSGIKIEETDFLNNGSKQVVCTNESMGFVIEPLMGGRMRSLEYRVRPVNVINGFAESTFVDGEELRFAVDPISGLRDWVFPLGPITAQTIMARVETKTGRLDGHYDFNLKKQKANTKLLFSGRQKFCSDDATKHELKIEKVITLKEKAPEFRINYQVTNNTFYQYSGFFGTEFNVTLSTDDLKYLRVRINGRALSDVPECFDKHGVNKFEVLDKKLGVLFDWSFVKEATVVISKIMLEGASTDEHLFQGFKCIALWPISMKGQESEQFLSTIKLKKTRKALR